MKRLLVVLLLVAGCGGSGDPSSRIVSDCQRSTYRPSQVQAACGDGGLVLTKLQWAAWTEASASGGGIARVNTCEPNCAEGTFEEFPVTVTADKPLKRKGYTVLSRLVIHFTSGNPFGSADQTIDPLVELDENPTPMAS